MKKLFTLFVCALTAFAVYAQAPQTPAGRFSVSATQQVTFAPGNLQFHMMDSTWRFAPTQLDWLGNANLEMGNPNYNGWVDLFCWSIGAENNFGATSAYDTATYVNKTFVDWGTLFEGDWYTLSKDEWNYLFNTRTGANDKWGMAKVGDTLGVILLPDEWTAPEGITFVPRTKPISELWDDNDMIDESYDHYRVHNNSMPANLFTEAQWAQMEAAGALFLPNAGRRSGGFDNYLNTKCEIVSDMFRYSYYENYLGTYWTSTPHNIARGQIIYMYLSLAYTQGDYQWGKMVLWGENGRYGQSVRLAKPVPVDPTALDQIDTQTKANKVIKNGQLFIERNGETFNAFGQPVR